MKAILTEQPLLRQQQGDALDRCNDNLFLFRCLVVHQGARSDRCTEQAKQLAGKFCFNGESQRPETYRKITLSELKK